MSVWVTASTAPTSMVRIAIVPITGSMLHWASPKATYSTRSRAPKAATLVQAAISAVTGVGAPWYTSGVQTWNGTAAILNSSATETMARPLNSSSEDVVGFCAAAWMAPKRTDEAKPYSSAMPKMKNADANAPSRKYLSAASWLMSRRRRASAHSRYSGNENTSSATNMV